MKIKSHEIGFDLDGVIAETGETFLRLACQDFGHCSFSLEDIKDFEVESCLGIPKEDVEKLFYIIMKNSLQCGLQPMEGAVDVITELARTAHRFLRPQGWLFVEIGADQKEKVESLFLSNSGGNFEKVKVVADWAGRPRVLQARKTGGHA
jgi:methylase of polypeptide subunit release factors